MNRSIACANAVKALFMHVLVLIINYSEFVDKNMTWKLILSGFSCTFHACYEE